MVAAGATRLSDGELEAKPVRRFSHATAVAVMDLSDLLGVDNAMRRDSLELPVPYKQKAHAKFSPILTMN